MQTLLLSIGRTYFKNYTGLPGLCWLGISLSLIESIFMGIFYFLSLYFVNVLHFSIASAGSIISCYGLGAIAGGYCSGKLSDKISPTFSSISSLFAQAFCFLALIKLHQFKFLVVDIFILGFAAYGFITSNYLWVLSLCKEYETHRIKALNLLSTASNLGIGIATLSISITSQYGFEYLFLTSGICLFLLASFLISLGFRYTEIYSSDATIITEKEIRQKNQPQANAIIWFVLLNVIFVGSIVTQRSSTYTIYIEHYFPYLGIKAVSILLTLNTFLVVLFATPLGNIVGKYNKIAMLGLGGFLIGFGMFMLSQNMTFSFIIVACIIYTAGEIIFFCMAQLICYQKGLSTKKGRNLGLFRAAYASSRVIGPAAGGWIYHLFGSNTIWYLSGIIGLSCLIGCQLFKAYD